MPNYQGSLDGLCGPYAIVNAFEHCGLERDDLDKLFRLACEAPAKKRWPALLWEGTGFGDLKRMIKRCREGNAQAGRVQVSYPFSSRTPESNSDYWKRFDEMFEQRPRICCMILGMTQPSDHWIVAFRAAASRRIHFLNADPHKPALRKNRTHIYAGERHPNPSVWKLERDQLALFEVGA